MGVVRDVTVEQLTSAIGNIDTSALAKDTTLQATNTALGNINTTLGGITTNDPPTDTTQQSIASAITGLGTTLGSDKANISGDNIADKATFRQNIEINKVFYSTGSIASDLNDCKAGGIYRTNRSTTNTPTSNYYIVLTMVFNENSDLVQLAIDVNFATLFIRSFHDATTWTAWKRCDNV